MVQKRHLLIAVVWLAVTTSAQPQPYTTTEQLRGMESYELHITREQKVGAITVIIHCDEAKVLNELVPDLRAKKTMPGSTDQDVGRRPITYTLVAAFTAMPVLVQAVYRDAYPDSGSLDRVRFQATILTPDDFGHLHEHALFSFTFNRALYRKIDWQHFQVTKLPIIAPGYAESAWLQENLEPSN